MPRTCYASADRQGAEQSTVARLHYKMCRDNDIHISVRLDWISLSSTFRCFEGETGKCVVACDQLIIVVSRIQLSVANCHVSSLTQSAVIESVYMAEVCLCVVPWCIV